MRILQLIRQWVNEFLVLTGLVKPHKLTIQELKDVFDQKHPPVFTDKEGNVHRRLFINDLMDSYINELMEQYRKKGIFNWNDIPFSIKKHIYTSMAFHSDGKYTFRDAAYGAFSDTNWNFDAFHSEPFDIAVDAYFKETCDPVCKYVVMVINQDEFDDLMRLIPQWIDGNFECGNG